MREKYSCERESVRLESSARKCGGWSPGSDYAAPFPSCGSWTELFEIWNSSSININVGKNILILKTLLQRTHKLKMVVALVKYISANLYYCVQDSHPQTIV